MGSPPSDQAALVEQARVAHRDHRYASAYDALRAAQELAPLDPEDLHVLSDAAWWLGLMSECLQVTESAHHQFLKSGRVERAAAQALDLGNLLALRGEWALASGWLGRARRLLERMPLGPTHGLLWFTDLEMALEEKRLDEVSRIAADMRALGDEHGAETLVALGHLGSGLAALHEGRVDDGYADLEEATLRVVGGSVEPEWAGYIYCTIVACCLDVADLNRARQWSAAAYRWLEGFDSAVMFTGVCRSYDVNLLVVEGDWDRARECAKRVVAELSELNIAAVAEAEYQVADADRLCGRFADAEAGYARAFELGREPQPGHALLLRVRDEHEAAWAEISDALARSSPNSFECARLLRAAVEIALAAGHAYSATAAARRLAVLAARYGTPGFLAWADHSDALVAVVEGRHEEARTALIRAGGSYRKMRAWYDAATVDLLLGLAHRELGEEDQAIERENDAAAVFRRLGTPAPPTPQPKTKRALVGGLTQREAEVLRHVAAGLSNREAAAALSISEATVRRHLANVYLKLGLSSRTQAAAWAHEHGLVPSARS